MGWQPSGGGGGGGGGGTVKKVESLDTTLLSVATPTGPTVKLTPKVPALVTGGYAVITGPATPKTIHNGINGQLTWGTVTTDPTALVSVTGRNLTFEKAGLYVVTVIFTPVTLTVGGSWVPQITCRLATVRIPQPATTLYPAIQASGFFEVGTVMYVYAGNYDGVVTRPFKIASATVGRIGVG